MTVTARLIRGDCIAAMAAMPADSVDALVTDPPYGLEFMGKDWDRFRLDDPGTNRHRGEHAGKHGGTEAGDDQHAARSKRVAVEYGGGKRASTFRCVGCGKRDQFRNAHKCGDGVEWRREIIDPFAAPPTMLAFQNWTRTWGIEALRVLKPGGYAAVFGGTRTHHRMMAGLEDAGFAVRDCLMWLHGQGFPKSMNALGPEWRGWGTALKPAWEAIALLQRPMLGTIAGNLAEHGVGALNINATRLGDDEDGGRWPSNVAFDESAAALLDEQSGERSSGKMLPTLVASERLGRYGKDRSSGWTTMETYGDKGGASRFFYTAKADQADRGLQNEHPTVKPLDLMRWLVLLICPAGGTVLDPFAGSGTTLIAARYAERSSIGCEMDPEFAATAARRFFPEVLEVEEVA